MPELIKSFTKPDVQIDCHILTFSKTREEWLDACIESLLGEACNIHLIRGIDGDIGKGRAFGYMQGTCEYVTFVDCDDYVLPNVMQVCADAMADNFAVITQEYVEFEDGRRYRLPVHGHHIAVYRRSHIVDNLDIFNSMPYRSERRLSLETNPTRLDFVGYVWHPERNQSHRIGKPYAPTTL